VHQTLLNKKDFSERVYLNIWNHLNGSVTTKDYQSRVNLKTSQTITRVTTSS
jgi:hypothetical protein